MVSGYDFALVLTTILKFKIATAHGIDCQIYPMKHLEDIVNNLK